jgi:hypothetical protein
MTDAASQEMDDLVDEALPADPPADDPPPKKRRRVARKAPDAERTLEDLDTEEAETLLDGKVLPAPSQNIKTLGAMYAKFRVGEDPAFKLYVYRTWPKFFRGGKKADGFYDSWETALTEEQLQTEYGGGTYRVVVMGPHSKESNKLKHYDSFTVSIAGDPKELRVPRALQGKDEPAKEDAPTAVAQPFGAMVREDPKISTKAMEMMGQVAERERDDRHRAEDSTRVRVEAVRDGFQPVIEAERRRADEGIAAERRMSAQRREFMETQLSEERERGSRMESANQNRGSFASDLAALAQSGVFGGGGDVAKDMLQSVLEKHRGEVESVQRQHTSFVESLRAGHQGELAAIRDAHRREMEAEREAARSRESRVEDRLGSEREERRRDQERYRETQETRDTQWKDRMEQQEAVLKSSWESRHSSLVSQYETHKLWMQGEIDRVKSENQNMQLKRDEAGDPMTQIARLVELKSVMKDALGVDAPATPTTPSGGIGMSGSEDWRSAASEAFAERVPEIISSVMGGFQKPDAPQQPKQLQYQLGQSVPTPQGEMIVVRAPNGEMMLAPREAVEQHHRAQQGVPPTMGGGAPQQPAPQRVVAVPNLAEGLPKRRPAWEGGGLISEDAETSQPLSQPQPPPPPPPSAPESSRMTSRPSVVAEGEPAKLSATERAGINAVAQMVHDSVMGADEPEEFVAKAMNQYDPTMLRQIVGSYTTDQLIQGIAQVHPTSAGTTPAGQQFVRDAFRQLRAALRE